MADGPALIFGKQVFPIGRGRILVGRGDSGTNSFPDLDLEPLDNDRVVSRQHAEIRHRGGITTIRDLGGRSGTFVNDERLQSGAARPLEEGDSVRFGHIAFAFSLTAPWPDNVEVGGAGAAPGAGSGTMRALRGFAIAGTPPPSDTWTEQIGRIQQVLTEGLLTMAFQPIVDIQDGGVRGVESLARLTAEPRRSPDLWFIEAKNVGLGVDLELAAITEAVGQLHLLPPTCYMAINASPETANAPGLTKALAGVTVDRVVLEVTEHDAVTDYRALLQSLQELRARGLRLAVDDMGSGYANLSHILQLAPEIIKLDVGLTRGIDRDAPRRALAASFAEFAGEIGAQIVAEGIETETEFNVLKELGVQLGQGYFMARPGPLPLPAELRATP